MKAKIRCKFKFKVTLTVAMSRTSFALAITMLILCFLQKSNASTIAVNVDIDLGSGSAMVNDLCVYQFSVFTDRIDAGTFIQIRIPMDLTVVATVNSSISTCKDSTIYYNTNAVTNNTLTNCIYKEYVGYSAIEYTVTQSRTTIDAYFISVGMIRNPSSARYPDSFEIYFSGGYPTGSVTEGLILTYIPNLIYSATLTHSQNQAGTSDTYVFKFKITNNIVQRGKIRLTFPTTWSIAPSNILSITTFDTYGTARTGFNIETITSRDVVYTDLFNLATFTASSTQFITITLTGITNPNSIVTTPSFVITTLDDAGYEIDQVSSGLIVTITQPGTITVNSRIINDLTVDAATWIQFTITPSVKYSSGGYVEVVVDTTYMTINTPFSCSGFAGTIGTTTCTRVSSSTGRMAKDLSSSLLVSVASMVFNMQFFKNPLGVMTTPAIAIYFKESNGSIVAQNLNAVTYTTTAAACTVQSAVRSTAQLTVGQIGAQYTLTFTCAARLPTVGRLQFVFPEEQVAYYASTTCQDENNNDLACTLTAGTGIFTVSVQATKYCSTECQTTKSYTLRLINARNPYFINSPLTNSVQITTQNLISGTYYTIATLTTGIYFTNDLVPGTLTSVSLTRSGSALTGGTPTYTFSFTTATQLSNGAVVSITFPIDTAYYGTSSLSCKIGSSTKTCTSTALGSDSTQISNIIIQSACTSTTCTSPTTYSVVLTNFLNPFSTVANTNVAFTIQTKLSSSNGLVDQATFNAAQLALTANALTVSLVPSTTTTPIIVGNTQSYTFTISSANNKLPSAANSGSLVITFPSQILLTSTSCSAQTNSITLTCVGNTAAQTVTVTSPSDLAKNTVITVSLVNNVRNPQTGTISNPFTIKTLYSTGEIDQNTAITVTPDTYNSILSEVSTRDIATVGDPVVLTIEFTTTNPIPQNALVKFQIPTDQAVRDTTQTFGVTDMSGGGQAITIVSTLTGPASSYNTFTVREWCSDDNVGAVCPAGYVSKIKIVGFKNPANARIPTLSIKIEITTSAGAYIDKVDTNFFTIPNLNYGALQSLTISRDIHVVGQTSTYTFTFQTAANGAMTGTGYVNIVFPVAFMFNRGTTTSCTIKDATSAAAATTTTCTATSVSDPNGMGNYVSKLVGNIPCGTINCAGGASFTFTVTGYYNAYSTMPRDGTIISVYTSQGTGSSAEVMNLLDRVIGTTLPKTELPDFTAGTITVTSLLRTVYNVDTATNIQFTLVLPTRLEKNGYIQVSVPSTQFVPNGNNFQYQLGTGTSSWGTTQSLTVSYSDSTQTVFLIKEWCSGTYYCADNASIRFQIVNGFSNVGYVSTPTNFFTITTLTDDALYTVDTVTGVSATPSVIPAVITVSSVTFDQPYAAYSNVQLDIELTFGANIAPGNYVLITLSNEFIRNDAGTITCFIVEGSVETAKTCTTTATSNVLSTIQINSICTTTCSKTTTYKLRFKNVVNRLYVAAFSGTMLIETRIDASTLISQVSYNLAGVTTLSPGPLTPTVVRSVATQGLASVFTITWTIPGYLIDNSIVELRLPLNQIVISTGTAFTFNDGTTTSLGFASTSTSATHYNYELTEWKCTGNCASGVSFTVRVNNAKNPFSQSTDYDDFEIIHKTTGGNQIFKSTSPLDATPDLAYGVIDNIAVTHANSQYVARTTEYTFSFRVTSDIPQGGKLKITFPMNRVLSHTTTMVCTVGGTAYTCTPTYASGVMSVIISGVCPSAICTAPITYSVSLTGGMKNPSTVAPLTGSFTVQSLSSGNFIVSQGTLLNSLTTQVLPEPITPTITRTSPYMAAVNDYKLSFQTVNAIPSGGFIRVIFPVDQVVVPTLGPSCKIDFVMTNLTCSIVYRPSGFIWVDIKSPCTTTCTAGELIQIAFQDVQNPSSFTANDVTSSWAVYTMNSAKEYIDGLDTGLQAIPDLIGKISIIQGVELDNNTVAQNTFINFLVIPGSDFTSDSIFDFYFPDQFAFPRSTTCYVILGGSQSMPCNYTTYTSGYLKVMSLSDPCPLTCDSDGNYQFRIPIKNRGDNYYTGGQFEMIGRYAEIDVSQGKINNVLTFEPALIQEWQTWNDGRDTIEATSKLFISIVPYTFMPGVSARGRIRFVIPSQITLQSTTCSAKYNMLSTGMTCSISGSTITVTHSLTDLSGKNLTVEVSRITNPETTRPTDPILTYTEVDSQNTGTYYQIDQSIVLITYKVNGMTTLRDVSITRLPMTDERGYQTGQVTQLLFNLQLRHALESTASIIVQLPEAAQVKLIDSSSTATCYSTDKKGNILNLLLCQIISTNRTIKVRNYCQVATCAKNDRVYFKMYDDFIMNYHYVVDPLNSTRDSMLVRTTTREGYYYIDETSTDVFILPALQPTNLIMPSPEIIRTNNVINRKVNWVTSFRTNKNPMPYGSYLVLTAPAGVLLAVPNSTVDALNYDTGALHSNFSVTMHTDGVSVKTITIYDYCNKTDGCIVGSSFSLMVDWIKNPTSQLGSNANTVTIDLKTPEGYGIERGTTPAIYQLFSQLIPVRITNLFIRPFNPIPSAITTYEFSFSADAEFSTTDVLIITFPPEYDPWPLISTSRMLQNTTKCTPLLTPWANLTCTQSGTHKVVIKGLFLNNNQQYALRIANVQNTPTAGPTSGFLIEVETSKGLTIASRSSNTRIDILVEIKDQSTCNRVCGSCAGTSATCTSCKKPSKYPIFKEYACVDDCGIGYFFDQTQLECFKCHHGCEDCYGPGKQQCYKCADGYFNQDGSCVPYCSKGLIEDKTNRVCQQSNSSLCSTNCATCSLTPTYCLSCRESTEVPVLDLPTGKCIQYDTSKCNNTNAARFYIDNTEKKCKVCNELCKTCDGSESTCTSCWELNTNNKINELYETCVDVCGLGTWYNKDRDVCSYCNSACLMCSGYESDQCLICNKTPEARQLYLYEGHCTLQCPQRYFVNEINNECQEGQAQILSFSFLFMFLSLFIGFALVALSLYKTKRKEKTLDIIYAITSSIEFLDRFFLLGNLWVKANVFALAVCFMNLIATCAIGVFFNFLFMSPIYAHSPHFRTLYKKHTCAYQTVTCLSYFGGVNLMRLLCANFLNIEALRSDLTNWKFYVVPLNLMANFTILFTLCQLGINVFVLMTMTIADDAFVLAILGLITNVALVAFQFYKHLSTRAFLIRN